jgi:hypothetical protein
MEFIVEEKHREGLRLAAEMLRAWARVQEQRNEQGVVLAEPAASHWAAAKHSCATTLERAVLAAKIDLPTS